MNGDLTVQVKDPVSMNMGYKKVPLNVRYFTGDSLMVSDIQLYLQPFNDLQKELLPITNAGGFEITPYPFKNVASIFPVTCFFEIYNIKRSGIKSSYDLDISVTRIEMSMFERLKKLISSKESYTTGISRNRRVENNDSSELISFDISNLKRGRYILEVVVTDKDNKKASASASKTLDITKF
jgi:hypothetical protein